MSPPVAGQGGDGAVEIETARSTPRSSWRLSWSRSVTGRSPTGPGYATIGVALDGEKDILGRWAGTGGEGAKFWMGVLTDIKNRGVKDTFFMFCDGHKGFTSA